jgi:acyl-CoA hydrolase
MEATPASATAVQLARWMGLGDADTAGNVHGGTVMKRCDEAAALAAIRHSRSRVVTAGMDRMAFLFPIRVGELVTFSATVNAAWNSSMEVGVRVDAENPVTGEARHTNTAYLTMVALDAEGRPKAVPPLIATNVANYRAAATGQPTSRVGQRRLRAERRRDWARR